MRPTPFQLTVENFMKLDRLGAFPPDQHVELINGVMLMLPPAEPPAAHSASQCIKVLSRKLGNSVAIRCSNPVHLGETQMPLPDVVIATKQSYATRHPGPADIHLILEIADPTLSTDLTIKRDLYAQAGIPEYWVLDLPNRQLHVFIKPRRGCYTEQRILMEKEGVQCTTVPGVKVKVKDLLP